ncbi:hypothetical protein [Mesorhizobium sophorae]|nr:hypothetical protein [Mesorhizobium sophorae]
MTSFWQIGAHMLTHQRNQPLPHLCGSPPGFVATMTLTAPVGPITT